mgnify:CR=1 FL=1
MVGESIGSGQDALLLHAGGETRAVWRPVMTRLAPHGLRSIAFDQRGHGESNGSPADGVIAYGDDAKAMIEQLNRPIVVGASLGGFALMLALENAGKHVAGLVLVDVTPAPNAARARAYLAPRGGLGASPIVEDILARADMMTRRVSQLRLPIMLVCAGKPSPLHDDDREHFLSIAPHASIRTLDKAGHLIARDAPDDLADLIAEFARNLSVNQTSTNPD